MPGYINKPNCILQCKLNEMCGYGAISTVNYKNKKCNCICRNKWTGDRCNVCPIKYNKTNDCNGCSKGRAKEHDCDEYCTIDKDCNGIQHAFNVTGYRPNCICNCKGHFHGSKCHKCPINYDSTTGCTKCAYMHSGPKCIRDCNKYLDCNPIHTKSVIQHLNHTCTCICKSRYGGLRCSSCLSKYRQSLGCYTCANGHEDWKNGCPRICTNHSDCHSHAINVTGNLKTGCKCNCLRKFEGKYCENNVTLTPTLISNTSTMTLTKTVIKTLTPTITYTLTRTVSLTPTPTRTKSLTLTSTATKTFTLSSTITLVPCSIRENCFSINTKSVTGSFMPNCKCNCLNQYIGAKCEVCPQQFDSNAQCNACANGYIGFPDCSISLYILAIVTVSSCKISYNNAINFIKAFQTQLNYNILNSHLLYKCNRYAQHKDKFYLKATSLDFSKPGAKIYFYIKLQTYSLNHSVLFNTCISKEIQNSNLIQSIKFYGLLDGCMFNSIHILKSNVKTNPCLQMQEYCPMKMKVQRSYLYIIIPVILLIISALFIFLSKYYKYNTTKGNFDHLINTSEKNHQDREMLNQLSDRNNLSTRINHHAKSPAEKSLLGNDQHVITNLKELEEILSLKFLSESHANQDMPPHTF